MEAADIQAHERWQQLLIQHETECQEKDAAAFNLWPLTKKMKCLISASSLPLFFLALSAHQSSTLLLFSSLGNWTVQCLLVASFGCQATSKNVSTIA